jgi:hypothetical protein
VQQHAASFTAQTEASTGAELPRFIKDEFNALLECGILAHGLLRLRCGKCGHDKASPARRRRNSWTDSCKLRYDLPCRKPTRHAQGQRRERSQGRQMASRRVPEINTWL